MRNNSLNAKWSHECKRSPFWRALVIFEFRCNGSPLFGLGETMWKRLTTRMVILIALSLPMFCLQTGYIMPKPQPSMKQIAIQFVGWPFVRDIGAGYYDVNGNWVPFDQTHVNGEHYGYSGATWMNLGIGLATVVMIFAAFEWAILSTFPRYGLREFFLAVFAAVIVALFFRINPPLIVVWDDQVMSRPEMLKQTIRPIWQSVVASIYMFLFVYSTIALLLKLWPRPK